MIGSVSMVREMLKMWRGKRARPVLSLSLSEELLSECGSRPGIQRAEIIDTIRLYSKEWEWKGETVNDWHQNRFLNQASANESARHQDHFLNDETANQGKDERQEE